MSEVVDAINSRTTELNQKLGGNKVFDPRVIEEDGSKRIWSSESVKLAENGLKEGYKLVESPYLKTVQGALLRRANLPFQYTEEELEILQACFEDKFFFCDNFGKLKDAQFGWQNIKLRDYQRELMHRYDNNRWNIIMFPRQSGKTTTTVLEICYFLKFNQDKDCVVIAQSEKVVNEILGKIKECFAGLPFFMQPGFVSFTKKGCVLDNGCRLSIGIASESVVQGFSLDFLYIDEFAYIKNSLVDKFWNNIYPTLINNPESKCIITSTPNGRNKFYQLWTAAESKQNKFVPYRIYWYDVPGRDEQFKIDTIANVGPEGWEMGFECSFDTQLKSIFHSTTQKKLRWAQKENQELWSRANHPLGEVFDIEFISQEVIKYNLKQDYFLIGVDLGEGLEQDETILKIKKLEWDKKTKQIIYRSIGVFHSNEIAVEDFATMNLELMKYFDINKVRWVVENNNYGGEYFNQIKNLKLYESRKYSYYDEIVFAKFNRDSKDDYELGIRWNQSNKKTAVKSFSNLVRNNIMEETHYLSIEEYLNFGKQKNNTYAAQYGHDDLVMADVSMSYFINSNNLYAKSFFIEATSYLRDIFGDVDPEVQRKHDEEARKEKNKFKLDGWEVRDHQKEYDKRNNDKSLLLF